MLSPSSEVHSFGVTRQADAKMTKLILIVGTAKNTAFMVLMIVKNAVLFNFMQSSVAKVYHNFRGT